MGVACGFSEGKERCMQRVVGGNLREEDHLENPSIDGRIILKLSSGSGIHRAWIGLIWLRIKTGGGRLRMW
jgi:hypothetical protein